MLHNLTQNMILAENPQIATTWWRRARGMIARDFQGFDAFIIPACSSVHTWLMTRSLDLVFVDSTRRVVQCMKDVKPWRLIFGVTSAKTVIELPAGKLYDIPVSIGDQLSW